MMKWWKLLIILLCLSGVRSKASFGTSSILGDGTGSESRASIGNILGGGIDGILGLFGGSENQATAGDSTPPQPDSGYLVLKVDLLSSDSANISALIQPIMTEVEQLLETGLLRGTFKLTWVTYDQ